MEVNVAYEQGGKKTNFFIKTCTQKKNHQIQT